MPSKLTAVLGLVALLAGCTDGGPPSGAANGSPDGSGGRASEQPSAAPAHSDPVLAALLDPVVADAATRLSVAAAAVQVISVEAVTWSDGSLGCPEPGMLYTQALVDGHRVVVGAGDVRLDYRVTGPGAFRVCENPAGP